jgi:ABC-type multidrug transport system fused ATPase/permease subunit
VDEPNSVDSMSRLLRRDGAPRSVGRFIRRLPRRDLHLLARSAAVSIAIALLDVLGLGLLLPVLQILLDPDQTSGLVDALSTLTGITDPDRLALVLGLVAVASFLLRSITAMVHAWWNAGLVERINADVTARLIRSYLAAPYLFHLGRSSAELIRNLRDSVGQATSAGLYALLQLAADAASVLAITATLIVIDPLVTIGLVIYLVVVLTAFQLVVRRRLVRAGMRMSELTSVEYSEMAQTFGGIKGIYVLDSQAHFEDRIVRNRRAMGSVKQRLTFFGAVPRYYLEAALLFGVGLAAAALFSARSTEAALTSLALLLTAGFRILPIAGRTLHGIGLLQSSLPHFDILSDELDRYRPLDQTPPDLDRSDEQPTSHPLLDVRDVAFSFPDTDPVLRGISLQVEAGTSLGIVGASGAGKTTLLDVLLGLHQPSDGEVLVDGHPLQGCARAWRSTLGYVPQDVFLLDDTIRENIAFSAAIDTVDEDLVWQSLEEADLGSWARGLPDGILTAVGERGVRISGGQRQRLGLARALYRRPTVLVLDEATSSLDVESEARIMDRIEDLRRSSSMTTIVVAHRLSTVRRCDTICMLHEGRVLAMAPFDELVREEASFARMARLAGLSEPEAEISSLAAERGSSADPGLPH